MAKVRALADKDYIAIGKRYGSDDVSREAAEKLELWQLHLPILKNYGLGQQSLDMFKAIYAAHTTARETRPEAVAAKRISIKDRNAIVEEGWDWIEQVHSALAGPAESDQALADKLNAAEPADVATLDTGLIAFATLLQTHKEDLDPDFDADGHIASAPGLCERIRTVTSGTEAAKAAPKKDTQNIDLLDGKLVVSMARLNRAGRHAFRRAQDKATRDLFRFKYLSHKKTSRPATPPTE